MLKRPPLIAISSPVSNVSNVEPLTQLTVLPVVFTTPDKFFPTTIAPDPEFRLEITWQELKLNVQPRWLIGNGAARVIFPHVKFTLEPNGKPTTGVVIVPAMSMT